MLIPFSPRHFQHPGTSAVSTPTPGDQWRAFMLRSTEAEERVGSRVRRTLSPFKELLRFNFNSDAFSPSPPAREPQRTKPPHSPPGFPLRPRHGPAALPLDVSQGHGLGPRCHADSVLPHPAPATPPPSPRIFSVLYLFASIVPPGGRVLFAYLITRSQEPSPSSAALASPSFPGRKRHSTNVGRAPAARERRAGRPPGPRCGSPRAPPFPPVGNPGSQLPRLRHGILPPLPPASPCRLPQGGLLIGGSEGHSATLRARPRPRAGSGSSSSPYPLPLIAALRAPRSSGQSPGNWPRGRRAASGAA